MSSSNRMKLLLSFLLLSLKSLLSWGAPLRTGVYYLHWDMSTRLAFFGIFRYFRPAAEGQEVRGRGTGSGRTHHVQQVDGVSLLRAAVERGRGFAPVLGEALLPFLQHAPPGPAPGLRVPLRREARPMRARHFSSHFSLMFFFFFLSFGKQ